MDSSHDDGRECARDGVHAANSNHVMDGMSRSGLSAQIMEFGLELTHVRPSESTWDQREDDSRDKTPRRASQSSTCFFSRREN
eukprot:4993546-Pyramimonas_sp.AAC.1